MAKPNHSVPSRGEPTEVSFHWNNNNTTTMVPQAEAVSDHSSSSYYTLSDDVDSLWDDVSALRRDLKALTEDSEDYKDQSDETMNYIIRQQSAESKRVDESIECLSTELSNLKVQMSILREKTMRNELMLEFLMLQANPEARRQFEANIPPMAPTLGCLSEQLDRIVIPESAK